MFIYLSNNNISALKSSSSPIDMYHFQRSRHARERFGSWVLLSILHILFYPAIFAAKHIAYALCSFWLGQKLEEIGAIGPLVLGLMYIRIVSKSRDFLYNPCHFIDKLVIGSRTILIKSVFLKKALKAKRHQKAFHLLRVGIK